MVAEPEEWRDEFVLNYIHRCIVEDRGIPMFIKHIWGSPLPKGHVILACRDVDNEDLLKSYYLIDVPPEIEKILEIYPTEEKSEWRAVYEYLMRKYLRDAEKKYFKLRQKLYEYNKYYGKKIRKRY